MEPTSKKILILISQILPLLEVGKEDYWIGYFNYMTTRLNNDEGSQWENIESIKNAFLGGMGSFTDLVLDKDGDPLIEENNRLDDLKDQLYAACKEFLKISQLKSYKKALLWNVAPKKK